MPDANVERQLGAPTLRDSTPPPEADDFTLPPGWKSRYTEHREAQAQESKGNARARSTERSIQAKERQSKAAHASRRSPSNPLGRRTRQASLANPTGGRLPIGFDGEGIAGVFFGAVFYALVLSVADYGAKGPLYWFKAKFMNQPTAKGSS